MKDGIMNICKGLEKKHNIKILFAVENGSRAWRMDSEDSDYDVRFVFVRPIEEYIQIKRLPEVIEAAFDKVGNQSVAQGALIDISGFDVFKYVTLLSASNPTAIEWLMSDIIYYGKQNKVFTQFAIRNFSNSALYYHYKSMCKNNYLKYLKSAKLITYKKYLYAYRGLINAKWVVHKKSIPPIIFIDTLKNMNNIIPDSIQQKLYEIINLKSQGKEKDIIQNIVEMDQYIDNFLVEAPEIPEGKKYPKIEALNEELRKMVLG